VVWFPLFAVDVGFVLVLLVDPVVFRIVMPTDHAQLPVVLNEPLPPSQVYWFLASVSVVAVGALIVDIAVVVAVGRVVAITPVVAEAVACAVALPVKSAVVPAPIGPIVIT